FFLSEGWMVTRTWGSEGLWNVNAWRREPKIEQVNLCLVEQDEKLWLYRVEEAVVMVEVKPIRDPTSAQETIGQVVLKRLMSAEQAIELLCTSSVTCQLVRQ
ncbi:MAG: hypothetical protein WBD58_01000, partial [Geitlerinemataceae cyanobacterium]